METLLGPLLPLFDRERAAGNAMALSVLVHTVGSTYRKPGALMLIASNGDYAGLLSGGCLEGDLREHARSVIEKGAARIVTYDTRGSDDLVWGLGLGCEGLMSVFLMRVGPQEKWQPLSHLAQSLAQNRRSAVGIVVESDGQEWPVGTIVLPEPAASETGGSNELTPSPRLASNPAVRAALEQAARTGQASWVESSAPAWRLFALGLTLPPRLLLLGAGPDAAPVVELAARLGWQVTVVDHRPAYADASHFPAAERVLLVRPDEVFKNIDPTPFTAAVVMSHHLPSDLEYLRALGTTQIPYLGQLGPAARRERLLADLGSDAHRVQQRLRGPVGLPLGGRSPEAVALSIVAQLHAFLHGAAVEHG